jgi:hypothetical protein
VQHLWGWGIATPLKVLFNLMEKTDG